MLVSCFTLASCHRFGSFNVFRGASLVVDRRTSALSSTSAQKVSAAARSAISLQQKSSHGRLTTWNLKGNKIRQVASEEKNGAVFQATRRRWCTIGRKITPRTFETRCFLPRRSIQLTWKVP
jgi:hypothetical protein